MWTAEIDGKKWVVTPFIGYLKIDGKAVLHQKYIEHGTDKPETWWRPIPVYEGKNGEK